MNLATLNITKATLNKALSELMAIKVVCNQCTSYHGTICQQFKAPPPDEWVRQGPVDCEHWEYDGIPF